ncbi:unnamed protein product [Effrenium voratum]|nr:unnamed protein product [Effrenium voratum]
MLVPPTFTVSTTSSTAWRTISTSKTATTSALIIVMPDEVNNVQEIAQFLMSASLDAEGAVVKSSAGTASAVPFEEGNLLPRVSPHYVGTSAANVSVGMPVQLLNQSEGGRFLIFTMLDGVMPEGQAANLESGKDVQLLAPAIDVSVTDSRGVRVPIGGLEQLIFIRVSAPLTEAGGVCAFLTDEGVWSRAGVHRATEDELAVALGEDYAPGIWCSSTHLTIFAILLEPVLACTNLEVLSPQMLQRLLDSKWYRRTPGILIILTMLCCTVLVLLAATADRKVQSQHLWKQQFLLTAVPLVRAPCACSGAKGALVEVQSSPEAADDAQHAVHSAPTDASWRTPATMASAMSGARGHARSWARRLGIKVLVRGTLQALAAKLRVEESSLRGHVWNGQGWVQGSLAVAKSKRLAQLTANLDEELSQIFTSLGHRRWLRVSVSLWASHPLVSIFFVSFHITSAKRASIFAAFLSGSLALSALFMSAAGLTLDSTSDLECPVDNSAWRFLVVGCASMLLNAGPRVCLYRLGRRSFASDARASSQRRAWQRDDALFWLLASLFLAACWLLICSFLANLGQTDYWKCMLCFGTIILGKLFFLPLGSMCFHLVLAEATLLAFPSVLTAPPPELGLHIEAKADTKSQQSDVARGKIVELANRGIRVRHLLDFYEKILELDFFDPGRSTTHDVVRHAIIPWSLSSTTRCDVDVVEVDVVDVADVIDVVDEVEEVDDVSAIDEIVPELTEFGRGFMELKAVDAIIPLSLHDLSRSGDSFDIDEMLRAIETKSQVNIAAPVPAKPAITRELQMGVAYATVVNSSEPLAALRMVTHGWGNIFRNLLAAVFADALGQETYDVILELLQEPGLKTIRSQLFCMNKMDFPYWICAFCVNQHAGICSGAPAADSLGRKIVPCSCDTPKCFTGDGCEMNKFDEMMEYLRRHNAEERKAGRETERFGQVVALDLGFELFARIWCVAELVEAEKLHLPQSLKMHSLSSRERCLQKLLRMDVRMAQASYEADRALVLGKIMNVEAFNTKLKDLLFTRLQSFLAADILSCLNSELLLNAVIDQL